MNDHILTEAKNIVHRDRNSDYGPPTGDFLTAVQMINAYLTKKTGQCIDLEAVDIPAIMICIKLSRQANKPKRDNLLDIAGYSECWQWVLDDQEQEFGKQKQPDPSPIHQSRFWSDMQDHHVFISGPMTGIKDWNHPAFHAAEKLIWDNHQVAGIFNPATIFDGDTSKPRKEYIKRCVEWITQSATAIYMLKGWENSAGSRLELATAKEMGCEVFYEQFMVEEEEQ